MKRSLALLPFLATLLAALPAGAVEREHEIGADLGGAILSVSGESARIGGTVGAHYTYGITDQFNFLAEGAITGFLGSGEGGPTRSGRFGVGAAYVLDVMRIVPYGGVLLEGVVLDGGSLAKPELFPSIGIALGCDYRINRRWSVGIAVREHLLVTAESTYPSNTEALLRGAWVFGW